MRIIIKIFLILAACGIAAMAGWGAGKALAWIIKALGL